MHGRHGRADQNTAKNPARHGPQPGCDQQSDRRAARRDQQGAQGVDDVVVEARTWLKRQHGHEMGGPDRDAAHQSRRQQQQQAIRAHPVLRLDEQSHAGDGAHNANEDGRDQQPPVVFRRQTVDRFEHGAPEVHSGYNGEGVKKG